MLQAPTVYALLSDGADFQINAPGTITGDWITGLEGMQSLACELRFLYGAGGATVTVLVQSAMGADGPAYDVAQQTFNVIASTVMFELFSGTTNILAPGVGGIDSTGTPAVDGILLPVLGDRLRLVVIVAGSYLNTVLAARVLPK